MPQTQQLPTQAPDLTQINLTRLLGRLEDSVLDTHDGPHVKALRRSSLERTKTGANVDYARTLLFRVEHTPNLAAHPSSSTQQIQKTRRDLIATSRRRIRLLQNRLDELAQPDTTAYLPHTSSNTTLSNEDSEDEEEEDDGDGDGDDILAKYAPALPDTNSGIDIKHNSGPGGPSASPSTVQTAAAAATLSSTLRNRGGGAIQTMATASASGAKTDRDALFANSASREALAGIPPFAPTPADAGGTTKLMEQHDSEQTALSDSLLTLATALKASSQEFAGQLAGGDGLVEQAARALERNVGGMEVAGGKMGVLRRMREGRGWWGRIGLYGWVGGLWVVLVLVMFVMPKLRF